MPTPCAWRPPLVALLVIVACMAPEITGYRRPSKVSTTCCKMVSSAQILFEIYGYERQNALGPCVEAIVFDTVKGKVCSNPKARWVMRKMKEMTQ
ncbi:eotaxin-like isoform X1 [Brienomyrus brachyistius]|uniref:eotaxin-like isoform X1 n=1 Tax=Brienomyrus brachyistius TaxID=42636 RepID=UPI0020B2FD3D|nr:eotaxin-like isoform X1 [Brienomyrus brachyistius]